MKWFCKVICLIIWMMFTLILTVSVIGMLLFISTHYMEGKPDPSTWMSIGIKLVDNIINS